MLGTFQIISVIAHIHLIVFRLTFSQQSVPPVMAFHLGSLGFLTPFKFDNFQEQVDSVLEGKRGAAGNGHYCLHALLLYCFETQAQHPHE